MSIASCDRAIAVLKANPDGSTTDLAKMAKCSRSTVVHARHEIEKAARKAARKQARETSKPAKPRELRERAQRFLRDALARGAKAHIDAVSLEQARADLGVVVSRGNAGGVQAVQWSLPG